MKIFGMQKLTLIDYPGKVAATIFLGGCNFRCPFCHNSLLVTDVDGSTATDSSEIFPLLKKRVGLLDGIVVSGGEPLMQGGIEDFIKEIKDIGYSVKLDTNGSYPDKLRYLVENKLVDYVAMDIKNSLPNYGETIGIENYDTSKIEESADFLMNGSCPYEFRTTVVKELHNKKDFDLIGMRFRKAERYYLQTFQDSGSVIESGLHGYNKEEMEEFRQILLKYIKNAQLREI